MKALKGWILATAIVCLLLPKAQAVSIAETSVETSKLVAYYEFEDAANMGKDSTDNGNDLKKVINEENIGTETGVKGNALVLAGSAGLAAWEDGAQADFLDAVSTGDKGYTVSFYAKVDTKHCRWGGSNSRVFCNGWNGTSTGMSALLNYNNDGSLACLAPLGGIEFWDTWSGIDGSVAADWHHVVAVYDPDSNGDGRYSIFVDGVQTVDLLCGKDEPAANPDWFFCIGGCWAPKCDWFPDDSITTESFIGSVDEFKVFNEAVYNIEYINAAVPGTEDVGPEQFQPATEPTAQPTEESSEPTEEPAESTAAPTEIPDDGKENSGSTPWLLWAGIGAAVVIAALAVILILKKREKQ